MDWGSVTAEDLIDALREVDWSSPPRPLSEFFSRFTVPRSFAKWESRLKCNLYYYRTNYFILIVAILALGFLRRPLAIVAAALTAISIAFLNDSVDPTVPGFSVVPRLSVLLLNPSVTKPLCPYPLRAQYQLRYDYQSPYDYESGFGAPPRHEHDDVKISFPDFTVVYQADGEEEEEHVVKVLTRPSAALPVSHTRYIKLAFFAGSFSEKVTRTVRQFSPHLAAKMRPPHTPVIRGRPSAKRAIYICGQPRWVFVLAFSTVSFILWFASCGLLTVLWTFAIGLLAALLHASFRTPNLKARLNTFREEFRAVWRNYSELCGSLGIYLHNYESMLCYTADIWPA
ncbi:hypothetical protein Cgig2_008507 [Carnegiea gigantea]|uniref:PRA1 family protein n=1 Tax=Carnegiea gigantea TaxID=171969 RepID=A0A9Q1GSE4_9CARY|nr:hypothetical protein Cgig2_008507 [Carnegiea gigantea]